MPGSLQRSQKIVGVKQTTKALQNGTARTVYVAQDADGHVIQPIKELCAQNNVPVIEVETMAELGRACSIAVGAAVAAIIE